MQSTNRMSGYIICEKARKMVISIERNFQSSNSLNGFTCSLLYRAKDIEYAYPSIERHCPPKPSVLLWPKPVPYTSIHSPINTISIWEQRANHFRNRLLKKDNQAYMLRKNLAQTEIFSSYLPLGNVD